ncbi:MAG: hypothetical protein DMF61_10405 [Blastocatellia bacterium AA13]|nr:MAG: hypothetical protein DMF61_10405 [Blastocatellia bacterium AA13]
MKLESTKISFLRPATQRLLIALACVVCPAFVVRIGIAHEPITTKIMFNREVVRVLQENCLGCHRPEGIAPMSLATYENARPWAKAIKEELLEKRMPPWYAVKGFGQFRNGPDLTQRDIDVIVNWVEGGAPKGDEKDLPEAPLYSDEWPLGRPDLVLQAGSHEVASDADERCVITVPTSLKEDRFIRAIDLRPSARSVVHSATLYIEKSGNERDRDKQDGLAADNLLGTWMPGQRRVLLYEGYGQLIPAGSRIKLDVHYRGSGDALKDSSQIGLYFSKTPPSKRVLSVAPVIETNHGNKIKASLTLPVDAEAVGAIPTGYAAVDSLEATAYRPDGTTEVLIWMRPNKDGWQTTYYYKHPVILPRGTRIEITCYVGDSDSESKTSEDPLWTSHHLCELLLAIQQK